MGFYKKKVVTCVDDNLEKWIGWKGYFANTLVCLRDKVKGTSIPETFKAVITDKNTIKRIGGCIFFSAESKKYYNFFYPVESPKQKQENKKTCENCRYSKNTFGDTAINKHLICTYDGESGAAETFWSCKDFSSAKQGTKYRPCKNFEELARSANNGHFTEYKGDDEKLKQYNIFNAFMLKFVYNKWNKLTQLIDGFDPRSQSVLKSCPIHLSIYGYVSFDDLFTDYEWVDKEGDARIIGVKE